MIPYSRQNISQADIRAVAKVLKSHFLTQGPVVEQFEMTIAKYTGARFCVAFSSGTAALHAAYIVAGIGRDDEVIVPAITFAATGNAALYLGARPVFADIDLTSGLIDATDVERKITQRTKAVVAVDYAGRPADIGALQDVARKNNLVFIEDGAQSLGARYRGRSVGHQADMTMFSFHPVKSITTGEGGVITTNDKRYYDQLQLIRTHGLTRNPELLRDRHYASWHQEMQVLGFNYRLTDIQAALGISQLKRLDSFIEQRRQKAEAYNTLLSGVHGIHLPPADTAENMSAWHLYALRLEGGIDIRDNVFMNMREKGIGVQVHYLPVYLHPYYADLGYVRGSCPHAEEFSFAELSIPLYPTLSSRDQKFVANTLRDILNDHGKA